MFKKFLKGLSRLNPLRGLRYVLHLAANGLRKRFGQLDYIIIPLPASMPALPEPRSWLQRRLQGDPPLSQLELERLFERIAADPRAKGVVIQPRGMQMSLADLQTLRASIQRLRSRGKRVVFYAAMYTNGMYYLASAGDEILLQTGGTLYTVGLTAQPAFLKNALDSIGLQFDAVAISPYKGAFDALTRDDISPEGRAQLEWLLDERYTQIVEGIATGRGMSVEQAQALIDSAPHVDSAALQAGYVDAVLHEEGLSEHLGAKHLVTLEHADKALYKIWRRRHDQYVAVLPLTGTIFPGESARPPGGVPIPLPLVGDERLGDVTVTRQVRALMKDKRAAAVILWIDSPGGSGDASEAMAAALDELAKDRPVVAYMHSTAASGGYYIATPARWIIAQPGTITGSIGVIFGKAITTGALNNLKINRLEITRGANAGFLSDQAPFSETQRQQVRDLINHFYQVFVQRVARSRGLTAQAVDAVGGGRVWSGRQARGLQLVDELGDWQAAAGVIRGRGKPLAPQLAEQASPAAYLGYMQTNLNALTHRVQYLMPPDSSSQW
jgi:protease-4